MNPKTFKLDFNRFLATPAAPAVANVGAGGAVTYTYVIVKRIFSGPALDFLRTTDKSANGTTATGNATLDGVNLNRITWTPDANANGGYDIYRTAGGASQGLIGRTAAGIGTFDDTGLAGDLSTAPATNTTGLGKPSNVLGLRFMSVQVKANGGYVGTLQLQMQNTSADAVDEWFDVDTAKVSVAALINVQSNGPIAVEQLRVKCTAYTSGTPVVVGAGS